MKDQERTPLRVVLRNFLNHIENLESQNCPEKSYDVEFQDLKLFSENVKCLKEYSCLEGEKEVNRKKNRYKDILPFDLSRVVLNKYAGIPGSDYINANFIKGASGSPAYIASQGPLPSTVNDFWRMVVQCEVQVIVMACNEEEAGKAKCEKYWVDEGEEKQFGMISVKLLKSSTVCSDFSVRTMRLKYNNSQSTIEERTVCQLHYVAWPDHGVPTVVQPLLDMVRLVRDTQASETLPVLVHCSAGCGRTGTICAIDYVWGLLRTGKLTNNFSLLSLIREMRKQRIAMVQTKEQYVLVHQAVRELFKEQLCMIDSHPYENIDTDGLLIISKDDEHVYDSIESLSKDNFNEKEDFKKEKETPPPLPKKKQQPIFSTKKEKDVENLSAQQRAIHRMPKINKTGAHLQIQKPEKRFCLAENLKESNAPKKLMTKPIPSKGILRVPQLENADMKALSTIKRSKSLKVANNDDKHKLVICSELPPESKRRASLESNLEESLNSFTISKNPVDYNTNKPIRSESNSTNKTSINDSAQKCEDLNIYDHRRPLVRSYTTLDLRTKLGQDENSIISRSQNYSKVKLSRSNTQVDFSKMLPNKTHLAKSKHLLDSDLKTHNFSNSNSSDGSFNRINIVSSSGMQLSATDRCKEMHLLEGSLDGTLYDSKPNPFSHQKTIKDLRKVKPKSKKISPYQHLIQKESLLTPNQNSPESLSPLKEANDGYHLVDQPSEIILMNKPMIYESNGSRILSHNVTLKDSIYVLDSSSRNAMKSSSAAFLEPSSFSKSPRITGKLDTQFNKIPNGNIEQPSKLGLEGKKDFRNHKMQFPINKKSFHLMKPGEKMDIRHPDVPKDSACALNYACSSTFLSKESPLQLTPQKRLEMDSSGTSVDSACYSRPIKTSTPYYAPVNKRTFHKQCMDDSINRQPTVQSQDTHHFVDDHFQASIISKSNISDLVVHRSNAETKQNYDPPPSIRTRSWHLGNETRQFDQSREWNFGQPENMPQPFSGPPCYVRNRVLPTKVEDPGGPGNMDRGANDDYFLSAPGVDIDKVAASIPQKDSSKSNFMKVALEAFSLRQAKHQWKREDSTSKAKPEVVSAKKKQQQYL